MCPKEENSYLAGILIGVKVALNVYLLKKMTFGTSVLATVNIKMINDSGTNHSSGQIESNIKQEKILLAEVEDKSVLMAQKRGQVAFLF